MNHSQTKFTSRRLLAVAMPVQSAPVFAAICNCTGSGNWNAAIWSSGVGPGIAAGRDVECHLRAVLSR